MPLTAKKLFVLITAASALLAGAGCATNASDDPRQDITYETTELLAHGAYRVMLEQKFSESPGDLEPLKMEQTIVVLQNGREVRRQEGWRWETNDITPAEDITGDGVPDVVIVDNSGGTHNPLTYYILELRYGVPVHQIEGFWSFEQLDGRPGLEIIRTDYTFEDWKAPRLSGASPRVVLRYRDGVYEPAPDLMLTPPPSPNEFGELVENARAGEGWKMTTAPRNAEYAWDIGYDFLSSIVDLIYSGHANLVTHFADDAWPPAKPGKQEFLQELIECRIRESKFWPAIAMLNGLPSDPPIGRCLRGDNEG